MINSNSISTGLQTQFYLSSNSYKNSFNPSSSRNVSFNFGTNPLISIRKTRNRLHNAASTNNCHTTSQDETLYDLLGISQSVTLCDIKHAYKKMALKYHPDVSPPDCVEEYTERFIRVQEAYKTLSDPESRAMYDCDLGKAFSMKKGSPFEARPEEMAQWKQSWEGQVEELRRRSTVERHGGKMSWAARIRKQRAVSDLDQ